MQDIATTPHTPVNRLAASRAALLHQMKRHDAGTKSPAEGVTESNHETINETSTSIWQFAKLALAGWWQHHPLQIAAHVAKPYLNDYARKKPLQLLGLAAGLGVLAVVVKPWRLVSVTGLAALAAKSTNLPATLLSFITRSADSDQSASNTEILKDS